MHIDNIVNTAVKKKNNKSKVMMGPQCKIAELVERRPESTALYKNVNDHSPVRMRCLNLKLTQCCYES